MTCNAESNKVYKCVCVHIASKVNKLKKKYQNVRFNYQTEPEG